MNNPLAELAASVLPGPPAPVTAKAKGKAAEPKAEPGVLKPLTTEEKFKALAALNVALNKKFETSNSLIRLGTKVGKPIPSISTGLPTFDKDAMQCGGVPRGRVIEVFGPESSGKTTFSLHVIAEEQRQGGLCAFVDAEHALDPNYAEKLGVDTDNLFISQPDYGEAVLETVHDLILSRAVSLIVVDSVAAIVPKAELDGEMGDSHIGLQARLMSQAMRKLVGIAAKNMVTVIFINQIREKVGVMFGSPEVTTGGRALKFFSSVRIDIRKLGGDPGKIKSGDVQIGHRMRLKIVKNKCGAPHREALVDLIYGVGIDKAADMAEYVVGLGIVEKAGAWLRMPEAFRIDPNDKDEDRSQFQGMPKFKEFVGETPEAQTFLYAEIDRVLKMQAAAEVEV